MEKRYAIILVRVSTSQQDYEAQTLDLTKYGNTLGYTDYHIIETKETAFADLEHKIGTNEMFDFIKKNPKYNTVLMTEISRLGRRQSVLHTVKELCVTNQIQVYIKDLKFQLFDENGKITQFAEITFSLYGMFAESEVKQKLDRFKRKRKELVELGYSIGGKLLFGYDRYMHPEIKKNTLVVNKEQATTIRTIFNWYLNGLDNIKNPSIRAISIECVKRGFHPYTHSKRNVNKLLKEEAYTGFKQTNNKWKNPKFGIVQGEDEYLVSDSAIKYPVIIKTEMFNKIQAKLKTNTTQGDKETKHISILSKLIKCPACGRSLQANYRLREGLQKNSYRCTSRGDTVSCASRSKSLSMNLIDSAVWSLVKSDLPALSQKINEINPDTYLVEMESHLINLTNRESEINISINENIAILSSVGKLTSPNIIQLIKDTGKKIEKLESDLIKIEQEKSRIETNKLLIHNKQNNVEQVINDNLEAIEASKEQLKKYINAFVHRIDIIEHNTKYTVLEVAIRDYTYLTSFNDLILSKIPDNFPVIRDLEYIILDKRITRDIKGAFYKENIVFNDECEANEYSTNEAIEIIKQELKTNNFIVGEPLNYKKLNY